MDDDRENTPKKKLKYLFDPRQDVLRFGQPKKQVFCPLCPLDITALSISERNAHAEKCLGIECVDEGASIQDDLTFARGASASTTVKMEQSTTTTTTPIFLADEFLHLLNGGVKNELKEVGVAEEIKEEEIKEEIKEEIYFSADEVVVETPVETSAKTPVKTPVKKRTPRKVKPKKPPTSTQSTMVCNGQGEMASATPEPIKKPKRAKKPAPSFKVIHMGETNVAVDSFMHGPLEGIDLYFLSHFHADHYGGLRKAWNHGPIFCTPITAALCKMKLGVQDEWLVPIPTHIPFCVGKDVEVIFFDANHCPGAAVMLFTSPTKTAVHCGDFRANMNLVREIKQKLQQRDIDEVYLDTTYLGPSHAFPSQNRVVQVCADFCVRLNNMKIEQLEKAQRQSTIGRFFTNSSPDSPAHKLRTLFVVGTYTIGKERLAVEVAMRLGSKLYADTTKRRILKTFNDPVISELLTSDPLEAQVHLVPLGKTRKDMLFEHLKSYKPHFSKIVAFAPTGWSYRPPKSAIQANEQATDLRPSYYDFGDLEYNVENLDRNLERTAIEPVQKYNVPYSEHSSFVELRAFCLNMAATSIIPTVNMSSEESVRKQMYWLDMWTGQAKEGV